MLVNVCKRLREDVNIRNYSLWDSTSTLKSTLIIFHFIVDLQLTKS